MHPLSKRFAFWYLRRDTKLNPENYLESMKQLVVVTSVEDYWALVLSLRRPSEFKIQCEYHLFVEGALPVWEDPANENGCRWIIRLRKEVSDRIWERMLLLCASGSYHSEFVCGVSISVRAHDCILSLWVNKKILEEERHSFIQELKERLSVPLLTIIEYKENSTSLKDMSSYKNTSSVV